jgi:2-dehydropantoate 2-reductase
MTHEGPRILIVGSGAVGAVFGEHLTRAGARVNFLVRNPDGANARMPRALHQLHLAGRPSTVHQMLDTSAQLQGRWDQCWLCLPSTALDSDWLHQELDKLDPGVELINWTPDLEDRARLEERLQRPVSMGLIGFVSYQSPLPGETRPGEGIAYWLPPRAATLENTRAGERAANLLKNGGLWARRSRNLPWLAARLSAVMITLVAALEREQWSLEHLRRSPHLDTATRAAREAMAVGAAYLDTRVHWSGQLPRTGLYRGLLKTVPPLAPFNLENYLGYHFAKVADQTRLMLDTWIAEGHKRNVEVTYLEELRRQLP